MMNIVTHIDMKRSLIWTFNISDTKKLCKSFTELYLWINDGNINTITDERIHKDLLAIVSHHNKITDSIHHIKEVKILQRNKVDDLIY